MVEEVGGTIEWAKGKIADLPKAKRDLGPLLDALGRMCLTLPKFIIYLTPFAFL
jgi:hypothetical protein